MTSDFLLYGSTGLVGDVITRLAVQHGLRPLIAGRNAAKVESQAAELGIEWLAFELDDPAAIDRSLERVPLVLHCAGPFAHTYQPMAEGCLRSGRHYLDITGEMTVFAGLAARDAEARTKAVMLLPAVGFDVAPSDCLALHLKRRLPTATHLTLAFCPQGPAGLPPGTINTMLDSAFTQKRLLRRDGQLVPFPRREAVRAIDFGQGPVEATLFAWGDVFTAFHSTGIQNIEEYFVLARSQARQLRMLRSVAPLLRLAFIRRLVRAQIPDTNTPKRRAVTRMSVWGEVRDGRGQVAVARLHGPEAGVVWTSRAALASVRRVLGGTIAPGFQTPAMVFGPDFVLESEGVRREDVV